jgi:glucose-6-phosphate isomerase
VQSTALTLTLDEALVPVEIVSTLVADHAASRLFAQDDTLWGVAAQPEASIRLGWVDPDGVDAHAGHSVSTHVSAERLIVEVEALRAKLLADGIDRIVLSGMGGSSLAPEVITRRYGVPLIVLDSTHPSQVRRALGDDLSRTALVVSSKSGSTVETQSHRETFDAAFLAQGLDPADRIIVVTDPGSPFESSARERGNRIFLADPHVGGRYSALTAFGLVPAGLAGADIRSLVNEALTCRDDLAADSPENPAVRLAAAIFAGLPDRYALALASHPHQRTPIQSGWGLPDWIEQLVAESTGKLGHGVFPFAVRPGAPETSGYLPTNTLLLSVSPLQSVETGNRLDGPLGAQFLCWSATTALLGRLLGINPFDQPDVESAKIATREFLGRGARESIVFGTLRDVPGSALLRIAGGVAAGGVPSDAAEFWDQVCASVPAQGYLAIQAYLDSGSPVAEELDNLREMLSQRLRVPVSLGFGPRFLHSTGQLHKGGPAIGAFLQITDEAEADLSIPGSPQSYFELLSAQAEGDAMVLEGRGRPVTTVRFSDPRAGVRDLLAALGNVSCG